MFFGASLVGGCIVFVSHFSFLFILFYLYSFVLTH